MLPAPTHLWSWVYQMYWRTVLIIGSGTVLIQLIFGGPSSKMAGVVYGAFTAIAFGFSGRYPRQTIPLHLTAALLLFVWGANQPPDQVGPGWNHEIGLYFNSTMAALGVTALAALGGVWGYALGLAMMVLGLPHPQGSVWWIVLPFWLMGGGIGLGIHWGIQKLEAAREALQKLALKDPLTGLGNRRAFENDYERYQALSGRENVPLLLSIWDLDGLKAINDNQGHAIGDAYLQAFALALKESVRQGDALFRTGGDEFCTLHLGLQEGGELINRVRGSFAMVSVGYLECSGLTLDEAFVRADRLLYQDKRMRGRLTDPDETLSL